MIGFRAKFNFHKEALISSYRMIKKDLAVTMMTVFIISIILVLSSLLWTFLEAVHGLAVDWHRNKQISLFLNVPSSKEMESQLMLQVLATNGVKSANIKTAEDALQIVSSSNKDIQEVLSYLPENPLPAVIDVVPTADINTEDKLHKLQHQLQNYPNVELAKVDMELVHRFFLFIGVISNILITLIVILLASLILIMGNLLRLIINDREDEISVLKLIGASASFIRRPYLYIGCIYGATSGLLAVFILSLLLNNMQNGINDLFFSYSIAYKLPWVSLANVIALIMFSVILGWFGARIAVRRVC